MAVFRIEKTRDYTVMSNHHLRDMSLSLKAKGLLSLMLSLPENWDYTMKGLARICNALIMNTKGEGEKSSEDFWVKAERLYYSALIGYIWYEATEEEKNFITLLDLINASEAREDGLSVPRSRAVHF